MQGSKGSKGETVWVDGLEPRTFLSASPVLSSALGHHSPTPSAARDFVDHSMFGAATRA